MLHLANEKRNWQFLLKKKQFIFSDLESVDKKCLTSLNMNGLMKHVSIKFITVCKNMYVCVFNKLI